MSARPSSALRIFIGFASAAVCAGLSSCAPPDPSNVDAGPDDGSGQCSVDLNFDVATAEAITPGVPVQSILCPARDAEHYRFDVATAGTVVVLTLKMDTNLTRVNPSYTILRDDGSPTGVPTGFAGEDPDKTQGEPTNFVASHRIEEPGAYVVVVRDASGLDDAFDVSNAFTLQLDLTADPDTQEPNNDDAHATPLSSGAPATGQIATTGDEDWYVVDVPAGAQIVDATLRASPDSGVQHTLTLLRPDAQSSVLSVTADDTTTTPGSVQGRVRSGVGGAGRFFVVVKDASGAASQLDPARGAYTLSVTVVADPDANEGTSGNNVDDNATPLASGDARDAALAALGDIDVYKVDVPADASTTTPRVLVATIDFDSAIDPIRFQPQVIVVGDNPETGERPCNPTCAVCDAAGQCMQPRMQRFVSTSSFVVAYPLRTPNPVYLFVNELGDDAFQDGAGYSLRIDIVDDPDDGEQGDDFLIVNLESAGYANGDDLRRQLSESKDRARVLHTGLPAVCDANGLPEGCLPLVDVPTPIPGISNDFKKTVDCTGVAPVTVQAVGRLTYEGDRDYFVVDDLPAKGYWGVDFDYSLTGPTSTPLELTLFMHSESDSAIANTLETEQTGSGCQSNLDCDDGSICVDGECWADGPTHPTFSSHTFPTGDQCSFVSVVDRRPVYFEIVDNGINDFDLEAEYQLSLTFRCGCPTSCDRGGRCQGVAAPQ